MKKPGARRGPEGRRRRTGRYGRGHRRLFKGHLTDDTNGLYQNDGKGNFNDVTLSSGLGVETRFSPWGGGIIALGQQRILDLFLVDGDVYPELERKLSGYPYERILPTWKSADVSGDSRPTNRSSFAEG